MSTGLAGTTRGGATFYLTSDPHESFEIAPQRETNFKAYMGKKIAKQETERVNNHEQIRTRQLEMQEETRVRQILKEKKEQMREKKYSEFLKEQSKDAREEFNKINIVREDHFDKTQKKYKEMDNEAYRAHKAHMQEMEDLTEKHRQDDLQYSKDSHYRFCRDEQAWLDRRASLQRRCDKEAADGMTHLGNMNSDI